MTLEFSFEQFEDLKSLYKNVCFGELEQSGFPIPFSLRMETWDTLQDVLGVALHLTIAASKGNSRDV